ncbi:MAG TPA: glycosyltransferase family 4 protein, partial [Candidatus Paceibacterota bacterium]
MKRILIFSLAYHPLIGGAEIAVQEITSRIPPQNISFDLVTLRFDRNHKKEEKIGNVVVHRILFGNYLGKILFVPLAALKGIQLNRQKKFDAAWAIMTYMIFPIVLMRLFVRLPYAITLQDGDSFERVFKRPFILPFRPLMFYGFRHATVVQTISNYLAGWAKTTGFLGSVFLIPNGVAVAGYRDALPTKKLKKGKEEVLLISVSRLVEKNGLRTLIAALPELPGNVRLVMVGSGPLEAELRTLAKELGIAERVQFVGEVAYRDIPAYLKVADIFVRPSRSEGMGTAFIEAMAAGVPVVGTAVGGIIDFLKDGETGLVCKVGDPHSVAEKVNLLLKDPSLRQRIIQRAFTLVQERYDWSRIAKEIEVQAFTPLFKKQKRVRLVIATPLFPPEIGGPATYSKLLLDHLPRDIFSVTIVRFGSVRGLPKIVRHISYFFLLLIRSWRSDIIYAQDPVSVGLPTFLVAILLRKKLLLRLGGDYAWEQATQRFGVSEPLDDFAKRREGYPFFVRLLKWVERTVASGAELIIVPSNYLKGVVTAWGIPAQKIKTIYSVFEPPRLSGNRAVLRGILQFEGQLLMSVGRLVPWKGFKALIESMPEVLRTFPDAKLFIIGDGPQEQELLKTISKLHLEEAVALAKPVPHDILLRYIEAADVFVLNTRYEGFSHQLLEAMAVGTAIITTAAGGNAELVTEGKEGLVVVPDDTKALAGAIGKLFSDNALRERLVRGAHEKCKRFTIEKMLVE